PWAALALMRATGSPAFAPRDTALVAGLSAPLARAVRDHALPVTATREPGVRGPGLLLFDASGELVSANDDARAWLADPDPASPVYTSVGIGLPMVVVTTLMQARAIAAERDDRRARVRMRSATGEWLVCHASCLRDADGDVAETALVIEPATASEIAPMLT